MPNKQALPLVAYDGQQAYASAYACDPTTWSGVLYLSLVGYRASVRAIWAALLDGRTVDYDHGSLWLRRIADTPYRTHAVALPENGLTHFVMLSVQATRFLERGQPFYALREPNDTNERFSRRFLALLDRAVGVPVLPHWAEELWLDGLEGQWGLITPCEQLAGIAAWRVDADADAWLALIKAGVQDGRLTREAQP